MSPFMLFYGREPYTPLTELSIPTIYTDENYYDDIRKKIKSLNKISREKLQKSREKDREKLNAKAVTKKFEKGEIILVKNFNRAPLDPYGGGFS
jgi:uncharacterized membrane protein